MSHNITRIGIDLAKNIFQVCATTETGKVIYNKTIKRPKLTAFMVNQPRCEVILEACGTSNYWSRVITEQGHTVKLINPAYVRPYVKTNKNDAADAEALCEAASRPGMRFVQPKTIAQQDIQILHRVRSRLVSKRTSLCNQIRGLLGEYGITIAQGRRNICKNMPTILEDAENDLTFSTREVFALLYEELVDLDSRIQTMDIRVKKISVSNPVCEKLMSMPGVGPMVATAIFSVMGDPKSYRNGREFAAYLGLVPRQYSTGGKSILKGISKRGDTHTRTLLVQGANAALLRMGGKDDRLSRWAMSLKARKGHSIAIVALANKMARICWSMVAHNTTFEAQTTN